MATGLPMPKRIKDLPPLEPDSEDEFKTPYKKLSCSHTSNSTSELDTFGNSRIPKKVAELSPLESDSDEETKNNDRLNCAILNDSFILSPTKSIDGETPMKETANQHSDVSPKDKERVHFASANTKDDSFSKHFQALNIDEKENISNGLKALQPKSRHALFPPTTSDLENKEVQRQSLQLFSKTSLAKINDNKQSCYEEIVSEPRNISPAKSYSTPIGTSGERNELANTTPLSQQTTVSNVLKQSNHLVAQTEQSQPPPNEQVSSKEVATPLKLVEHNFITPQVKYQMPVSRRPNFSTSTSQKSRSALENEFRSQKILFRTPISMARTPALVNNSINLSLDDTVKSKDSVPVMHVLSPVHEVPAKKSSDELSQGEANTNEPKASQNESEQEKVVIINGNEYIILRKLGSGGSSSVFLSKRKHDQKECALKIVDLHGEKSVVEGYLNETKLLAKLQGNVNIVSLYEYQHLLRESTLYMVMEKGDSDLNKILQTYKTDLPLYVLISFWYQMLQSVNYIHENGVIHSDLKPANFLMVNGRLKLIDFGIASNISIDSTSIIKFSQAGTFNYISPEALIDTSTGNSPAGKNQPKIKISTRSDVWSLGCILYLLLYKKTPFGHIKNIYAKVNAISNPTTKIEYPELAKYYPPILIEMAKCCLIHDPKKRLSVLELLKYPFDMMIPFL